MTTAESMTGTGQAWSVDASRGVIHIGLRLRGEAGEDLPTALQSVANDVAAFFREYFPGLSVAAGARSVTLRCPGSLMHVMNVADAVTWHLGCLARWEGTFPFDAQVGVAFAADEADAADLVSRAETAAECRMQSRRRQRTTMAGGDHEAR
ncbi:hypothetical protein [Occultella gossypii]|uniref:Uncharacterized protein n=1 Tax=Occultella gossypii TaxID=2800820 RepID=A0ABS7SGN8_9MICO|nr:hypothetical protein [Occultella gossypii]MBZ2199078.1 hypothetical protein [Occultella gossypii]